MTTYKIVVARYQEDISWLKEFLPNVIIQNKGDLSTIPSEFLEYTNTLPNVGLDQYCFLRYIIDNYQNLPDTLIFTQGSIKEHIDSFDPDPNFDKNKVINTTHPYNTKLTQQEIIKQMIKQVSLYGYTSNAKVYRYTSNGTPVVYWDFKVEGEKDSGFDFGQWFTAFVNKERPDVNNFLWFKNAFFGVAKQYILSRPKKFYEDIIASLVARKNEADHFIERSWYYMLNMDKSYVPHHYEVTLRNNKVIFEALNKIVIDSGVPLVEGSIFFYGGYDMSFNVPFWHKQLNLFNLAKKAKYIMEVGFNAGHSTALMLMANPSSKILIFDLCEHPYTKPALCFLKAMFGEDRFIDFVEGDSTVTIPGYKVGDANIEGYFDLIHIDGGHSFEVAKADIVNCQRFARGGEDGIVVVDDTTYPDVREAMNVCLKGNGNVLKERESLEVVLADYLGEMSHWVGTYWAVPAP